MQKTANAYAKINLYLDIVSKRENGYHDIKGIMQKISLHDTVGVSLTPSEHNSIFITCSDPSIPTDEKNIAYKAADAFLRNFAKTPYKVDIHIEKCIPAAGGLAGGSTDAAAVLKIMRELIGIPSDIQALMPIAAKLGADVPFCLADGSMITEGIGDILTKIRSLSDCIILITNTGEKVSTPEAYGKLDVLFDNFKETHFDENKFSLLCQGLKCQNTAEVCSGMYNIFESAVLTECKLASEAKKIIKECGAAGAMMSGSGPTVFGIFSERAKADLAFERLNQLGYSTHICTPIN